MPAARTRSKLETRLLNQIQARNLPAPVREFAFAKVLGRRFRFDFAWPDLMLAVEVHGAVHSMGRHVTGPGFERDREKMNLALLLGWRVLEVTSGQVGSCKAISWLSYAITGQYSGISLKEWIEDPTK